VEEENQGPTNTIDKFPFATNANATDVGDLTQQGRSVQPGQSSSVSGYVSGGGYQYLPTNVIENFHLLQILMLQMLEI
jgi:hypothetical protein